MRKLLVFNNVSLDGYFEAPNHDISGFNHDFDAFSSEASGAVDTLLFGHRTYDSFKFWSTPEGAAMQPEIARFMTDTAKVVASHAPFEPGWKNVSVISGDVVGAVRKLKAQAGQNIMIFGSNMLCVSLMAAGLIDEFQLMINPVAFGDGTPLFKGLPQPAKFTLRDTRQFKSGVMLLTYAPAN